MANRTIEAGTLRGKGAQSLAILAKEFVFLSGFTAEQAGLGRADIERMPIEDQSSAIFEALDQALSTLGSRLDRAAKVKAYLGNMGLHARYRSRADIHLEHAETVHSVVGATCGAAGELVTVEVIAGASPPQEAYCRRASTSITASRLGPIVLLGWLRASRDRRDAGRAGGPAGSGQTGP